MDLLEDAGSLVVLSEDADHEKDIGRPDLCLGRFAHLLGGRSSHPLDRESSVTIGPVAASFAETGVYPMLFT